MVTQKGDNTFVVGITGNFDDAQTGVKKMFSDAELAKYMDEKGYQFSSANSINIGQSCSSDGILCIRLHKTCCRRNHQGRRQDQRGWFQQVTLVISLLHTTQRRWDFQSQSSSVHQMTTRFCLISSRQEHTIETESFISQHHHRWIFLISSNLERLIYKIAGNDAEKNSELMKELTTDGVYTITDDMKAKLAEFYGGYATEAETAATIKKVYESDDYIIDTHTAVAATVYEKVCGRDRR